MPPDLVTIVARAAARSPGPVAERSLAAWRSLRVRDVPISDPAPNARPLRVAPNEQWCLRCYEPAVEWNGRAGDNKAPCPRCGYTRFVPAAQILRAGEYYIAN